jgi:hypothetical protein
VGASAQHVDCDNWARHDAWVMELGWWEGSGHAACVGNRPGAQRPPPAAPGGAQAGAHAERPVAPHCSGGKSHGGAKGPVERRLAQSHKKKKT